jgi:hypothetical protein
MTEWIRKASLAMRPPWSIVVRYRFHIGRSGLGSPFYEIVGRIDENLDPGGGQAHVCRARLLLLSRHSFMEKERRTVEVKPGNPTKVPQLVSAERFRIPADRCSSVGHDQHHRDGGARIRVTHT